MGTCQDERGTYELHEGGGMTGTLIVKQNKLIVRKNI